LGSAASSFERLRLTGASTDREAYLCFKCHSSATTLADGAGQGAVDLTIAFNPNNQSYHNVLGMQTGVRDSFTVGGETYNLPWGGGLINGWTRDSAMTCTDCHTGGVAAQAKGPHGSSARFIVDPAYPSYWGDAQIDLTTANGMYPSDILCAKCHSLNPNTNSAHGAIHWYQVNGVNQLAHGKRGSSATCTTCHVAIPHGWKRPRLLAYASDPAPYARKGSGTGADASIVGIRMSSRGPTSWGWADCEGCSTYAHNTALGAALWP
jgi:hypothetical protein